MHIHIHVYIYTGLADTMGQEPVRHLVADRIVAPPEHRALFSEHLILLHTYHFYSVRGNRFAGDGVEAGSQGNRYALRTDMVAHRHGPPSVCVCALYERERERKREKERERKRESRPVATATPLRASGKCLCLSVCLSVSMYVCMYVYTCV